MSRIAFYSADPGNHKFINPIIDKLRRDGFDCILYNNWTYDGQADVLWFDFCDNNLIAASRDDKEYLKGKKVIARLHAVEYYMGFHTQIDWSVVDDLIFVSDHLKRLCNIPEETVRQHVIHNGIDLEKMHYKERHQGKVIGYAGNIVPTKGIIPMLLYFKDLLNMDSSYKLKLIGLNRFHGREGEFYYNLKKKLGNSIEESEETNDINGWFESIDYLWQPSLAESFSLIVGEAMAKGVKPIINDFYGAKELWPNDLVYEDFEGFYRIVKGPYESWKYREFVERYSLDNQVKKIKELL